VSLEKLECLFLPILAVADDCELVVACVLDASLEPLTLPLWVGVVGVFRAVGVVGVDAVGMMLLCCVSFLL